MDASGFAGRAGGHPGAFDGRRRPGRSAGTGAAPVPPPPPPNPLARPAGRPGDLAYVIVNEAGASVYSASPVGREEFPNFDATLRGTISIGRRLQDPLSELVKIDPQHVGVGLYQHDVSPRQLRESLDSVVESCVNTVGVDLNTASVPLLRHVSGLNQLVARDLIEHRKNNGPFQSRDQLKQVNGIGEARFIQAAGFLKIAEGGDPLDATWIHPESYAIARQILSDLGFTPEDLRSKERLEALREKLNGVSVEEIASRLQTGPPTVDDILGALARPGRDPREAAAADLQEGRPEAGRPPARHGAEGHGPQRGRFRRLHRHRPEGQRPGPHQPDGQPLRQESVRRDGGGRRGDGVGAGGGQGPAPRVADDDPARHGAEAAGEEAAAAAPRRAASRPPGAAPRRGSRPPGSRPPAARRPAPSAARARGKDRGEGRSGAPGRRRRSTSRRRRAARRGAPCRGASNNTAAAPPRITNSNSRPPGPTRRGRGAARPRGAAGRRGAATAAAQARRNPPKPNLSQAALAGATPLGTFAELAAFWEAKKKEDEAPQAAVQPPSPDQGAGETPPPT